LRRAGLMAQWWNGMKMAARKIMQGWLLVGLLAGGCASWRSGPLDLAGRKADPLSETNGVATVLIFVSNDCPISNRYAPEIRRLEAAFGPRGVRFWMVHADPRETAAEITEHDRQFDLRIPALRDTDHFLMRLSHAEVTPTAAIFTPGRKLVYHGRIDDRVTDLQRERPEPTQRDLAEALEAVLSGKTVPTLETPAFGCFIPKLR